VAAAVDRLTQAEMDARAKLISNPVYRPTLRIPADPQATTYESETTVDFDAATPGASSFIDLTAESVQSATLNGSPIDVSRWQDSRLPLDNLQAHNTLTVKSTHAYSNMGAAFTRVPDPEDGNAPYLHTQLEHNHAHKVFASFDQPDIKGVYDFAVEAPTTISEVRSNALPTRTVDLGGGMQRTEFERTETLSTYLAAVVAGPFTVFTDSYTSVDGREIPLSWMVRRSQAKYLKPDVAELFEITKAAMRQYETEKGKPYPYTKLDQAIVPGFKAGAMENAGMVTYSEVIIFRGATPMSRREWREEVIYHELDHVMGDGDPVTMREWADLGLNEASATAGALDAQGKVGKYRTAYITAHYGKATASAFDQRRSTHPVFPIRIDNTDEVHENFDALTYEKGAATLRQLRTYVGEQAYVDGMRRYYREHWNGNATRWDRIKAIQAEVPDKDLTTWAKQWWEAAGINVLTPRFDVQNGVMRNVAIDQGVAPNGDNVLRTHVMDVGLYDLDAAGALQLRKKVRVEVNGAQTAVPALDGEPQADLVLLNDGDLTYAKARLDDHSRATVLAHLSSVPEALSRAQLLTAAWDMVRDAEMPAREFVELVTRHAAAETEPRVLDSYIQRGLGAIASYADPAARDGLRDRLAAVARVQMERTDLDESSRLGWFDAYLGSAMIRDVGRPHAADVARVKAMLKPGGGLPGIPVGDDPDMRWKAVVSLAGAGALTTAEIDAEGARDGSIRGQASYLQALASRPTMAAKQNAYRMLVQPQAGDPQMTPQNMRALMAGFGRTGQDQLVSRFTHDYPDTASKLFENRTQEEFQELAAGLLPPVGQQQLSAATAMLALPEIAGDKSARRIFMDAQDDSKRIMAGRARDAAEGPLVPPAELGRGVA
jgi:aminopeptidase N